MNIKAKFKQYGLKSSCSRSLKFLLRRIGIDYESYYLMVNRIDIDEINRKMEKFDFSDVEELSLSDFEKGDPNDFTASKFELIKSRFESGKYWAFGIIKNDMLVYSCWINTAELQFPTRFFKRFPFRADEGLLQDAYCHPDYRGKKYHSKMNLYRLFKLYELKKKKAIVIVLNDNIPAFKSQLKSGFIVENKITFLKILNRIFLFD
ncbi:hypothetical protein [Marinifilum sp. D737]|uniref:hypothetical protein n=1 Tax=Marinifilum sp. D737 TaxID=2969628 RepID=UPI002275AF9F|nr:hypothetical protein [Marinifilum sp. D737]MCY1635011.1 hypothetical protein [Marinifilum sp. D737]